MTKKPSHPLDGKDLGGNRGVWRADDKISGGFWLDMTDTARYAYHNQDPRLAWFARKYLDGHISEECFLSAREALRWLDAQRKRRERRRRIVLVARIMALLVFATSIGIAISIVT